jgi:hypothetical protein
LERQEKGGTKRSRGGHRVSVPKEKPTKVIPGGQRPTATLQLADLEAPFPIDWEQQRAAFGFKAKAPR